MQMCSNLLDLARSEARKIQRSVRPGDPAREELLRTKDTEAAALRDDLHDSLTDLAAAIYAVKRLNKRHTEVTS